MFPGHGQEFSESLGQSLISLRPVSKSKTPAQVNAAYSPTERPQQSWSSLENQLKLIHFLIKSQLRFRHPYADAVKKSL